MIGLDSTSATYVIQVTTSDRPMAGTDARVYIELIGKRGVTSGRLQLDKSLSHKHKFEQGQTDIFQVKCPYVGKLKKIMYTY